MNRNGNNELLIILTIILMKTMSQRRHGTKKNIGIRVL